MQHICCLFLSVKIHTVYSTQILIVGQWSTFSSPAMLKLASWPQSFLEGQFKVSLRESQVLCLGKDCNAPLSAVTLDLSIFLVNSSIYSAYSWSGGQLSMRWEVRKGAGSSYQARYTVLGSARGCWWVWEHWLQRLAWGAEGETVGTGLPAHHYTTIEH